MRALILALLLFSFPAFAENSGTFATDGNGDSVRLQYGTGYVLIGAGSNQNFGSGTLTLQIQTDSGEWVQVETYTALPDPNPVVINLGGAAALVRLVLSGSSSPNLDWEIVESRVR